MADDEILFTGLIPNARFSPGYVVVSTGIHTLIQTGRFNPGPYLVRHLSGDWGDLNDDERQLNEMALQSGTDRLVSSYEIASDLTLWIITEPDHGLTTLLLASEG